MFYKSKHPLTEESILRALAEVQDPDLHRDIVSLGFVKGLNIRGDEVELTLELTTPACPVKEELKAQCEEKVLALGAKAVHVTLSSNVRATTPPAKGRIALPTVKNVIAIASGKGGVGKSTVTVNLAVALARTGAKVGLMDADIYGPSIPLMMGAREERPLQENDRILPIERNGVRMMSMGYLVPEDKPVIWRGPMVHGALTQFMTQVEWGDLDYLLIDMPPGTGDAQLTISQTAPLSGAIIVTTPQEVSLLDARRGLMMFQSVHIPILGIIENMSGFLCSHCNEVTPIFRKGGGEKFAQAFDVPLLGTVPLDPRVAEGGDTGLPMVQAHPDSEVGRIFSRIAGDMAARLSVMHAQSHGQFKPLGLEWRAP